MLCRLNSLLPLISLLPSIENCLSLRFPPQVVKLWQGDLAKINPKAAESLANPEVRWADNKLILITTYLDAVQWLASLCVVGSRFGTFFPVTAQ